MGLFHIHTCAGLASARVDLAWPEPVRRSRYAFSIQQVPESVMFIGGGLIHDVTEGCESVYKQILFPSSYKKGG